MLQNEINRRIEEASNWGYLQNKAPYDLVTAAIIWGISNGAPVASALHRDLGIDSPATIAELQLSPPAPALD